MPSTNNSAVAKAIQVGSANVVRQICALVAAGIPAHQARQMCEESIQQLPTQDAKQFELVWLLATKLGGPVVVALGRVAEVFDRQQRNLSEVQLAFAGPQSTAKLVTWLPVIALFLAQAVGMNPARAIISSPVGLVSVFLGAGLLFIGHRWSKRLLAKALPTAQDPGAFIDCVLIGLQAGLPLQQARIQATAEYQLMFDEPSADVNLARAADEVALDEAAELSRKSGASLTQILSATADRFRDELRFEISNRIARLGVRLMIPLGIAVLPAFVLIAIVPIAISLLSNGQL